MSADPRLRARKVLVDRHLIVEHIALQRQFIDPGVPVQSRPAAQGFSRIGGVAAGQAEAVVARRPDQIGPPAPRLAQPPSVAHGEGRLLIAGPHADQRPHGLPGRPGDDVDHPVHGVRPVQRPARPADHLDPLDVLQHQVARVPEHARAQGRIQAAPVDHDQQLVGGLIAVEPARADRIVDRIDPLHVQIGGQPQHLGQAGRARAPDVLGRDDEDGRRRIGQGLGPSRHRDHLDHGQFFQRHPRQVLDSGIARAAEALAPGHDLVVAGRAGLRRRRNGAQQGRRRHRTSSLPTEQAPSPSQASPCDRGERPFPQTVAGPRGARTRPRTPVPRAPHNPLIPAKAGTQSCPACRRRFRTTGRVPGTTRHHQKPWVPAFAGMSGSKKPDIPRIGAPRAPDTPSPGRPTRRGSRTGRPGLPRERRAASLRRAGAGGSQQT